MTPYVLLDIAGGLFGPPCLAVLFSQFHHQKKEFFFWWWWVFGVGLELYCATLHDHVGTLSAMASVLVSMLLRGRNRKRGRVKALFGNKTRALRAALVRKMRQAAKPRPVLRPSPGGAS